MPSSLSDIVCPMLVLLPAKAPSNPQTKGAGIASATPSETPNSFEPFIRSSLVLLTPFYIRCVVDKPSAHSRLARLPWCSSQHPPRAEVGASISDITFATETRAQDRGS